MGKGFVLIVLKRLMRKSKAQNAGDMLISKNVNSDEIEIWDGEEVYRVSLKSSRKSETERVLWELCNGLLKQHKEDSK